MNSRTEEIISRFEKSWTETFDRFQMLINNGGFDKLIPIRNLISEMRENDEWKHFRIGTSMFTLIFSRSVDFGLRTDQKHIKIETINFNEYEVTFRDADKLYREYIISDLKDVRLHKLLNTLKGTLVD
ncbi:hypothetical protein Q4Q34_06790 [Flavivirga abyssicola]|uniref:hypothetical protein n=1 Tax=Flavivirga abyssicola TaxID=3063533 RepID=UPI0026E0A68C|nr:hypothetical protein [Flavivirga sp. MEBiC07777]WVK14734.1 hypothetical protein Q4Q34_06790 [Flavivirga sp. MEBiC07777]